jgi:D-glycero-beta-D-manno-heptose-7-phosphate kinase
LDKLTTLDTLIPQRIHWRANGLKVVWTNGCFDLLHAGHLKTLQEAKSMGDILVVGVNGDRSVRENKGTMRPIIPESQRAELVASLECVDHVVVFNDKTPEQILLNLQPDVHCKGSDYADGKKPIPEAGIVKSYGGCVAFLNLFPGCSTTGIIEKILGGASTERANERRDSVSCGENDVPAAASLVDLFSTSKAFIIGDVMLDEYVTGSISRISPEAPVPVLDVASRRFTCGGAANVAANVASLSGVAFLSGLIGRDLPGVTLRERLREYGIQLNALIESEAAQTICKTRFVAGQQQIVRVDQESRRSLDEGERRDLLAQIKLIIPDVHVCVLSDYAKGLLDERMCQDIIQLCREHGRPAIVDPKGRNFLKYRGCTLITPNLRETGIAAEIEIKTDDDLENAGAKLLEMLPGTAILVTRGPDGMTLFRQSRRSLSIPTVARKVYDVVGAGDTAVATLAVALGAGFGIEDAIQLANIAAGVAVEQRGTVAVGIDQLAARPEALEVLQTHVNEYARNIAVR